MFLSLLVIHYITIFVPVNIKNNFINTDIMTITRAAKTTTTATTSAATTTRRPSLKTFDL